MATTCKGLFFCLPCFIKIRWNFQYRGSDFAILVALIWGCLRSRRKNICEIIKHIPPKNCFSWLLSEGIFSRCQMNFWKNVKVFSFNCRVIMRGPFYKGTQSLFWPQKYLRKRLYFAISCPCLYVGVLRKKSIKLLAKPRTDAKKVSFI